MQKKMTGECKSSEWVFINRRLNVHLILGLANKLICISVRK